MDHVHRRYHPDVSNPVPYQRNTHAMTRRAGAFLTGFGTSLGMLLAGRLITAFGNNILGAGAKIYLTEIVPPMTRGRWCGMIQTFYYTGSILATGVCIPLGRSASNWAWRVPLLLQVVPAFVTWAFVWFLPESPRFLYVNGQKDRAARILADLHSRDKDVNSPLIKLEVAEIEESVALAQNMRFWDFRSVFGTRDSRWRLNMALLIAVPGQLCGNGLTSCKPIIVHTNLTRRLSAHFAQSGRPHQYEHPADSQFCQLYRLFRWCSHRCLAHRL